LKAYILVKQYLKKDLELKIFLYSDLHAYPHSSLQIFESVAQNVLLFVKKYCEENSIDKIGFLGDFYHLKTKIHVVPYIKTTDILRKMRDSGLHTHFLIGNHDMPEANSSDYSIILSFQEFGTVTELYDWEDIGGIRIHYLSYTDTDLPNFQMGPNKNVLFTHLDINKFAMDTGFVCDKGFEMSNFSKFDYVFSGHFHKHQIIDNVIYVGSPYQTNFSERFDKKGFVIFDTDTMSYKFEPFPFYPKFKDVKADTELTEEEVKGNFIKIRISKNDEELKEKIKEKYLLMGAESVNFVFEDENEEKELNVMESLTTDSLTNLAGGYFDTMLAEGVMDEELKAMIADGSLNKDDFMKVFVDIDEAFLTGWKPKEE
jgi:DNA repair exonuclease SbcCD nuclease subunit